MLILCTLSKRVGGMLVHHTSPSQCSKLWRARSAVHATPTPPWARSYAVFRFTVQQQHSLGIMRMRGSRTLPIVTYSMPDDLDTLLISSRGVSNLDQAKQSPLAGLDTSSNTRVSDDAASVSSDASSGVSDIPPGLTVEDVIAHKRAAVQQAFLNNSLGFGFSAGGLLFPYYVGLVSSLVQQGVLERPAQLAGSSAGSLIAASFNAGLDMATVEQSMIEFGEDCLKNGTRYRLGPLLKDFLQQYLPPDAHEQCSGNTHVAVTRLLPYWRTKIISKFESRDDLIQALLTSCHIPWYVDGRWMTKFRGHYCVDGGVMAFIPTVPGADYTVKVMCFPSSHLEKLKATTRGSKRLRPIYKFLETDITMDSFEPWPYNLQQILKWALVASAQETSSLLIEKGKRDAALWVEAMELAPLVQQKKQHNKQQAPPSDRSIEVGRGAGKPQQQQYQQRQPADKEAAADWQDDRPQQQRENEARRAEGVAAVAEAAAAAGHTGGVQKQSSNVSPHNGYASAPGSQEKAAAGSGEAKSCSAKRSEMHDEGIEDVAAAAGVEGRNVKHALEAAKIFDQPNKRHRGETVAATAAAAVGKLVDGVKTVVGLGNDSSGDSADKHRGPDKQQ
eukprot:GHRR01000380.1.p1 GENE.GHRR01000380.1~~GHRR01000380.1.p1  ORF type:complete len:616 (+),score=201.49 GHRR01000380.1:254-2101(+)